LLQVGFQKMFPNSIVQLKSAEWCQTVSLPEGNQLEQVCWLSLCFCVLELGKRIPVDN
jgi:hypothetical protein